MIEIHLIPDT